VQARQLRARVRQLQVPVQAKVLFSLSFPSVSFSLPVLSCELPLLLVGALFLGPFRVVPAELALRRRLVLLLALLLRDDRVLPVHPFLSQLFQSLPFPSIA